MVHPSRGRKMEDTTRSMSGGAEGGEGGAFWDRCSCSLTRSPSCSRKYSLNTVLRARGEGRGGEGREGEGYTLGISKHTVFQGLTLPWRTARCRPPAPPGSAGGCVSPPPAGSASAARNSSLPWSSAGPGWTPWCSAAACRASLRQEDKRRSLDEEMCPWCILSSHCRGPQSHLSSLPCPSRRGSRRTGPGG